MSSNINQTQTTNRNIKENTMARQHTVPKPTQNAGLEDRLLKIASVGTIISGLIACVASVGIGLGLLMAGVAVIAEL